MSAPPSTTGVLRRLADTARQYSHLGLTSFGGPGVHVVILRRKFVDKLGWVDATTFADLFALGNALPGPGSTQLAFSIATVRHGALAGLLAFLLWSLPGAVGMAALGAGVRHFPDKLPPITLALLTGLNAAAVGLIALAAYQLSGSCITDRITRLIVLASASIGVCYHAPWVYPVLIAAGGIITVTFDSSKVVFSRLASRRRRLERENIQLQDTVAQRPADSDSSSSALRRRPVTQPAIIESVETQVESRSPALVVLDKKVAILSGAAFVLLILIPLAVRRGSRTPPIALDFFANMVIAGVIIFGGGPVVIPLLRGYTVDNGWVTSRDFLLGFAILQAFPGPNFNFAAYLGVLALRSEPALGAVVGWLGIFAPGLLLKLALLPVYSSWRRHTVAKSVLRGLNAAAAGLVWTAVWQLFLVGYIYTPPNGASPTAPASAVGPLTADPFWGVIAASAFVATQWFAWPPAVAIFAGGAAGLAWFGVTVS